MRTRLVLTLSTCLLLGAVPGGWQAARAQANATPAVGAEKTTAAVVEDVDPTARQILLRLPDQTLVTLKVGPTVDISGLKPGDHISARYVAAKLDEIHQVAGSSAPIEDMKPGSQGMVEGNTTIVAVDPTGRSISFIGPQNTVETIAVAGNAMIQAVTKLVPGDKAAVTYTPAIVVSFQAA
jgi:hypothetical protein